MGFNEYWTLLEARFFEKTIVRPVIIHLGDFSD